MHHGLDEYGIQLLMTVHVFSSNLPINGQTKSLSNTVLAFILFQLTAISMKTAHNIYQQNLSKTSKHSKYLKKFFPLQ
jgi:hypothetical protein